MDWITESIAIGNYLDAQDLPLLRQQAVASILGLNRTLHGRDASAFGLKVIEVVPLEDGPGNDPRIFLRAVEALVRLVQEAPPVLVHCHAGRSRSAIVVAGYLMKTKCLDAASALAQVASRRQIAVTPGIERLLDHID